MTPQRIQASRQHKEPDGCRRVTRGTKYGNKHYILKLSDCWLVFDYESLDYQKYFATCHILEDAHAKAVELYKSDMRIYLEVSPSYFDDLLKYKFISCFCPPELPCHCDAIIEHLARREMELTNERA